MSLSAAPAQGDEAAAQASVVQTLANGMQVLRSPQVLMADAALPSLSSSQAWRLGGVMVLLAVALLAAAQPGAAYNNGGAATWTSTFWAVWFGVLFVAALLIGQWRRHMQVRYARSGAAMRDAQARVTAWASQHPAWSLRLYATPWSLRVVATHATFQPGERAVAQFARGIQAGPFWADQCRRNGAFVVVARLADADAALAPPTRWLATVGTGAVHPAVRATLNQHDAALGLALGDTPFHGE